MADTDLVLINSDLSCTTMGDLLLISGDGDLIQSAINHMRTVLGEWFTDQSLGNAAYSRRLKLLDSTMQQMEYDCKVAILQDIRIEEVTYIKATRIAAYDCAIDFRMRTTDGSIIGSNTLIMLRG